MENNKIDNSTTVEQVDVDIDALFGGPTADSVMLPEEEEEKPGLFTNTNNVDTSFIDKPVQTSTTEEVIPDEDVESAIAELDDMISSTEADEASKGRPKVDKSGLVDLAKKMIEEGTLMPFDDDKSLDEYTAADFRELFEANFQERENSVKQKVPQEFFQALPQELQIAAKYVADGGNDLKGLFRTLAQVEEVIELSPENENHQAEIARQYLYATNFGTAEEIESEIEDWADLGKLEQKAKQFKPKLDQMQESVVARKLAEQEQKKQQQEEAARIYTDNVYNTLSVGELSGIKLDKKTQNMLFSGLVQPSYPSISGRPTNMLGHLLEKYQFVEPRHDLIAEALWLLSDPDGYKSKIQSLGAKEEVQKTARMLKTEQQRKLTSSQTPEEEPIRNARNTQQRTVSRKGNNMFKRF
jgi:hypothetical protein